MQPSLKAVGDRIALALSDISRSFKPGTKVCFLAGDPANPERDLMITLGEADIQIFVDVLERCKSRSSMDEVAVD